MSIWDAWSERWNKAKWHIARKEVPPFWELIPDGYQPTSRYSGPTKVGLTKVDDGQKKTWVENPQEVALVKNEKEPVNAYYTAFIVEEAKKEMTTKLNPPDSVDMVSFHLLNTCHVDAIEATATGTTEAEERISSRAFVRTHEGYWTSNSIPVHLSFELPVTEVKLKVNVTGYENNTPSEHIGTPTISEPSLRSTDSSKTPVFLISVDTLRRDTVDAFEPLIDALGPTAVVPEEPWTQGHWTRPSHATMLTGTHPGTHGYVAGATTPEHVQKISSEVPRLPKILSEAGYMCSACVGAGSISPEFGFGHGFQSFVHRQRDYSQDTETASSNIDQARRWLDDAVGRDGTGTNVFYFLHLFDPHLPYLPPISLKSGDEVDIPEIVEFKETSLAMDDDVTEARRGGETFDEDALERIRSTYERAVEETAEEIARLVEWMKRRGVFDDALIIVTGDHGEMFFERGFPAHSTLHYENLSPLMVVKPPVDSDMCVPDQANTIDFAPTICDIAGVDLPDDFAGLSWMSTQQDRLESRPRLTESIWDDWYSIAVQQDRLKGLFYWPIDFPDRPDVSTVEKEPVYAEFYEPEVIREKHDRFRLEPSEDEREMLLDIARRFVADAPKKTDKGEDVALSESTLARLEALGYK